MKLLYSVKVGLCCCHALWIGIDNAWKRVDICEDCLLECLEGFVGLFLSFDVGTLKILEKNQHGLDGILRASNASGGAK
jgi:hypothetical protein